MMARGISRQQQWKDTDKVHTGDSKFKVLHIDHLLLLTAPVVDSSPAATAAGQTWWCHQSLLQ